MSTQLSPPFQQPEGRGRSSTVATSKPTQEALASPRDKPADPKKAAPKAGQKPPTPAGKTKPKADEPAVLTQDDVDSSKAGLATADAAAMAASKELRVSRLLWSFLFTNMSTSFNIQKAEMDFRTLKVSLKVIVLRGPLLCLSSTVLDLLMLKSHDPDVLSAYSC